ncbi:MAG: hypothetical protein AAGD92_02665 [Pseudomonadota bacterium]
MLKYALPALSAVAMVTASAHAASWSEKIEMCVEAIEAEGLADTANYDVRFDAGSERRFTIILMSRSDDEKLRAECRWARGRVSSVSLG